MFNPIPRIQDLPTSTSPQNKGRKKSIFISKDWSQASWIDDQMIVTYNPNSNFEVSGPKGNMSIKFWNVWCLCIYVCVCIGEPMVSKKIYVIPL